MLIHTSFVTFLGHHVFLGNGHLWPIILPDLVASGCLFISCCIISGHNNAPTIWNLGWFIHVYTIHWWWFWRWFMILGLPPYPVRESTVAMEHMRNLFYRTCNGHVWFPKSFVFIFPPFFHHHVTFFTIGTSPCLPRVMADVRRTSESKLWRASSCVSQRKMDGDDRGF